MNIEDPKGILGSCTSILTTNFVDSRNKTTDHELAILSCRDAAKIPTQRKTEQDAIDVRYRVRIPFGYLKN